jgi:hypothetical protein
MVPHAVGQACFSAAAFGVTIRLGRDAFLCEDAGNGADGLALEAQGKDALHQGRLLVIDFLVTAVGL